MGAGKSDFEDAACSGEGEVTDVELIREALEALRLAEPLVDAMVFSGTIRRRGIDTASAHQTTRAVITKLEQRLLQE